MSRYDEKREQAEAGRFSDFLKTQKKGNAYCYLYCPKCFKSNGGHYADVNALNEWAYKEWGHDPDGKRMRVRWDADGRGCCF